jgi:hypothetical protein
MHTRNGNIFFHFKYSSEHSLLFLISDVHIIFQNLYSIEYLQWIPVAFQSISSNWG